MYILLILIILIILITNIKINEPFYDLVPYEEYNKIYKCYDMKCVIDSSYDCYKYCDTIKEIGANENCKMNCGDNADKMAKYVKYENVIFYNMNQIKNHSLLGNNDYF